MGLFDSPIEVIEDRAVTPAPVPGVNEGTSVHYFPGVHDILNRDRRDSPLGALVARVNEDGSLNLLVGDVRRGVRLPRNQVRTDPMDPLEEGYWGIASVTPPVVAHAFSLGFDQGAFK